MALKVRDANPFIPVKTVICGPPGIGKTEFGAKSDRPVFMSLEKGAEQAKDKFGKPVQIIEGIKKYSDVVQAVKDLAIESHNFGTLVLDSADWLERLVHSQIVGNTGKSIITVNKGYGAGHEESAKVHNELLLALEDLMARRGMHVIVTAHLEVKQAKDPSVMDDYDFFEMKCHKFISSMWREWSDAFLLARRPVFTKASDETTRARALMDDTRIVHTIETPFFKAKNRYNLPAEMPFTRTFWDDFAKFAIQGPIVTTAVAEPPKTPDDVRELKIQMNELWVKIMDEAIKTKVQASVVSAGDDIAQLTKIRDRLIQIVGTK